MKKQSRSIAAVMVVMLVAILGLLVPPTTPAHAGEGDNYPWQTGTAFPDCSLDDWGYCEQYCTSWVAWALHDRNGFETPRGLGDASFWKSRAFGLGYATDNTPAAGAVAWWSWNHVAWVKAISADGKTVTLEEYNNPAGSGVYNIRTVPATNPEKYIHFKDLAGGSSGGSATADGKFVSYHGAVYRIAGGAPLYVSGADAGWPALSGWASAQTITDSQWASLRAFPADGTYIADVQNGAVYVTVGGAPMYISGADAPSLPNWTHALPVPHWDFTNWQHLRQYPVDGYYLKDVQSGFVYNLAGGAAFYVTAQDAPALPQWQYATPVPHGELVNHLHLRVIPADGTYINDVQTGMVYTTLGGAPMYVSANDAPLLPGWAGATRVSHWEFEHWSSLQPYPADGTYVKGVPSGEVFVVTNGVATRVTTNPLPATTTVDDWAITNQLGGVL